jgi:hypothetical protein
MAHIIEKRHIYSKNSTYILKTAHKIRKRHISLFEVINIGENTADTWLGLAFLLRKCASELVWHISILKIGEITADILAEAWFFYYKNRHRTHLEHLHLTKYEQQINNKSQPPL